MFEQRISKEVCNLPGCQSAYECYLSLYRQHADQAQEIKQLKDERDRLLFNEDHKLEFMRQHINWLEEEFLQKEELVLETLQGKPGTIPCDIKNGTPRVCKGCVHHKAAFENLHKTNSNNLSIVQERAKKMQHIVESAERHTKNAQMANIDLRVLLARGKDPFWRDVDMESLKVEVKAWQMKFETVENEVLLLRQEKTKFDQQLFNLRDQRDILHKDLADARLAVSYALKRKPEAQPKQEPKPKQRKEAMLNQELRKKLASIFKIKEWDTGEVTEEQVLYDAFWNSMSTIDEKEHWLGMIYAATHQGQLLMSQERRLLQEGRQVCRTFFTVCLQAMGGRTRKRGNQNPFVNVEIIQPKAMESTD